jgi:tetratricopeptide (TPR) repeat protein
MRTGKTSGIGRACRRLGLVCLAVLLLTACAVPNSVLRKRAAQALHDGQPQRAQTLLVQALEQDRLDWQAHYALARLLADSDPLAAQLHVERALILRPDGAIGDEMTVLLAEVLYRQEKHEQALVVLEQAVEQRQASAAYIRLGQYAASIGDADGAVLAFRQAAAVAEPDDVEPYLVMWHYYESIGDATNALRALRTAHYLRPRDPGLADALRRYGIVPGPTAGLPPQR